MKRQQEISKSLRLPWTETMVGENTSFNRFGCNLILETQAVIFQEIRLQLSRYSDFVYETDMNNAAPVPTSSVMRNVMKSIRNNLDAHFNGEMNNKMEDIERFVDFILKRTMPKNLELRY
ncbi:hypothetical protein TNCV_938321 [Trichonephila clavipes]|nr:hypothetical protein TNCV_938321 [Trichonephila clavipes]